MCCPRELCVRARAYLNDHVLYQSCQVLLPLHQSSWTVPVIFRGYQAQVGCLILTVQSACRFGHRTIDSCPKPARSGSRMLPLVVPSPRMVSSACPKCGTLKQSSKRSCCARGGDWFKNCGHPGDTTLAHTWAEGIRACESNFVLVKFCSFFYVE